MSGGIESLAWLSGDWQGEGAHAALEEHFSTADGGTILGTSREVVDGVSVHREFLLFEERGDGLSLTVVVPGRQEIVFQCSRGDGDAHVFVGDGQRLTFRRLSPDRMRITFEKGAIYEFVLGRKP